MNNRNKIQDWYDRDQPSRRDQRAEIHDACFCIGPRNGEPFCPCRMRTARKVDGKWYQTAETLDFNHNEPLEHVSIEHCTVSNYGEKK